MAENERTAHTSTQSVGLGMVAMAGLAAVIMTLALFDGEDVALVLAPTTIAVAATYLTWRFDRQWARAFGLVATILSLGMFFLGFGVFQIFSPIEFIVGLVYVLGFFMSLVAGIRAIVSSRKGDSVPAKSSSRVRGTVVAVVGVAAVISVTGFLLTKESVDDAEAVGASVLEMVKFEFSPESSAVSTDGKLLIQNSDPFVHDFTLDDLNVAVSVGPGSETLVDLSGSAPGTYNYVCSLHSDGTTGMLGTITIEG